MVLVQQKFEINFYLMVWLHAFNYLPLREIACSLSFTFIGVLHAELPHSILQNLNVWRSLTIFRDFAN